MSQPAASRARLSALAVLLAAAGLLGACGVPDSGDVRQIEQVPFGLDATTSTTSTTTPPTSPPAPTDVVATEPAPIPTRPSEMIPMFFVATDHLAAVDVAVDSPATIAATLNQLLVGPPSVGPGSEMRTAIPGLWVTVRSNGSGVAVVDIPEGFFDDIASPDQVLAVGQIVLTLLQRPGLGQVRFTTRGFNIGVPLASGELSAIGRLLTVRDYDSLLIGPPPSTTSTSTSTTSTTTTTLPRSGSSTTIVRPPPVHGPAPV